MNSTKWTTRVIYVDMKTGEVLDKDVAIRDYYAINWERKYVGNNVIEITKFCTKISQLKLF